MSQARGAQKEPKAAVIPSDSGDVLVGQHRLALQLKVGSRSGAEQLHAGLATLPAGTAIPTHLHEIDEELLDVLEGEVTLTLNGQDSKAAAGDMVFIPAGSWMAIANHTASPAKILGVIPRAAMEECMRVLYGDSSTPQFEPEQLHAVCRLRSPESEAHPH